MKLLTQAAIKELYDLADRVSRLNPEADEIGAGMLRQLHTQAVSAVSLADFKIGGVPTTYSEVKHKDMFVAAVGGRSPSLFYQSDEDIGWSQMQDRHGNQLEGSRPTDLHKANFVIMAPDDPVVMVTGVMAAEQIRLGVVPPVRTGLMDWLVKQSPICKILTHVAEPYSLA